MKEEYDFSAGERGKFFCEGAAFSLPDFGPQTDWIGPSGRIGRFITDVRQSDLNAYREQPNLVREQARLERAIGQGPYPHCELFELIQLSADALLEVAHEGSILIRLTREFLYCADNGTPADEEVIEGVIVDWTSSKPTSDEIGRLRRGLWSVLRLSEAPEFYSRTGSFRFSSGFTDKELETEVADENYSALRMPEAIDPLNEREDDEELRELMSWANNIVRLPLKDDVYDDLSQQLQSFPPEILLFIDHVRYLTVDHESGTQSFTLHRQDGELLLETDSGYTRWRRFDITHKLSANALADWKRIVREEEVWISWAVPVDRVDLLGHFWAFFPTDTASLVAGILNAPWKTNKARQGLLEGPYNEELIDVAAALISHARLGLSSDEDPVQQMDSLWHRTRASDPIQESLLREDLSSSLRTVALTAD